MCTVTVVPVKEGYVFTFSRDESPDRYTPHFITRKKTGGKEIFYTRDSRAGGSWFAADDAGNIAMLFNGAFEKHEKKTPYIKSRGVVLLEMFTAAAMKMHFEHEVFSGIEPFSIILFERGLPCRLTWDGMQKHTTVLLKEASYIFSSATLYDAVVQAERRNWFARYLQEQSSIDSDAILAFHAGYKSDDKVNGLKIEREGGCSTLSISQAVVKPGLTELVHADLVTGKVFNQQINRI